MSRREPLSQLQFLLHRGSVLLLSLLVLVSVACAQPSRHKPRTGKLAKGQIESLELQWRDATINGDVTTMDKLLAEDYVGISWTGQVNTKAMQLDRIRTRTVAVSRMDLNDIKIKVVGPVAIVTSRATVLGTSDGNNINGDFRYTRVYQRIPSGAWQITNFESTRVPSGDRMRHRDQLPPPPS